MIVDGSVPSCGGSSSPLTEEGQKRAMGDAMAVTGPGTRGYISMKLNNRSIKSTTL